MRGGGGASLLRCWTGISGDQWCADPHERPHHAESLMIPALNRINDVENIINKVQYMIRRLEHP
jgi:hypothetical protein